MSMVEALKKYSARIYYGWWIAVAGALITCTGAFYSQAFSVFFIPFRESFALTSAQTALVLSLARMEGGLEGPISGWLIDRFGSRRMVAVGSILLGIGFILLGLFVRSYLGLIAVYVAVIAVGHNLGFSQATMAAMNTWFVRRRTITMSIQTMGSRVGGFLLVPLTSVVVLAWGWRTGAVAAGLIILAVGIPLSMVFRRSPEAMGLHPDGAKEAGPAQDLSGDRHTHVRTSPRGQQGDFELKEAFRSPSYWMLVLGVAARQAVHGAVIVHLVPMVVSKGISQQAGANMIGVLAFLGIPLTLSLGFLGDKMDKRRLLFAAMVIGTLGIVLMKYSSNAWQLYLAVALLAFSESVGALSWALLGDFFGRRRFATLRGTATFVYSGVLLAAPVYAGWVVDTTGSYTGALTVFGMVSGLSALIYLVLRRPALPARLKSGAQILS